MSDIKFTALGGQDERGKNLFVIKVDEEMFIFDAGMKFPDRGILGVDVVIPNFDFLKENKDKIKGIFISNPAAFNAGAINYILREINAPVYCNALITTILKFKSTRFKLKNRENNFNIIEDKQIIKVGNIKVEVFRTTSSFPESFGFALHLPEGVIVYAGDYIMDGNEQDYFSTDMSHLNEIAKKGVLTFISDSEFAGRLDYTVPKHKIDRFIAAPMKEAKKRLIIGIFEEDIFKLSEIFRQAKDSNRKIAVYGRTLTKVLEQPLVQKKLDITEKDIFSIEEYMQSENGILIVTGTGDLLYSRLAKIATGNDDVIEITDKDIIILATPPAPGVEKRHAQVLDELARTNAKLISLSDKNIWSMRASYEDIKLMTKIMQPKTFIPVKGLYKDFLKAKQAAIEAGVKPENVGIINNGQVLHITKEGNIALTSEKVKTMDVYVDGTGIGDIGAIVLNERKQLATDGVVIIGANIDVKTKEIVSLIDIQMRGVIYIQDDNPIFKLVQKQITDILIKCKQDFTDNPRSFDLSDVKREIIGVVRTAIKQESGKHPIVLAIVNEIDGSYYEPRPRTKKQHN